MTYLEQEKSFLKFATQFKYEDFDDEEKLNEMIEKSLQFGLPARFEKRETNLESNRLSSYAIRMKRYSKSLLFRAQYLKIKPVCEFLIICFKYILFSLIIESTYYVHHIFWHHSSQSQLNELWSPERTVSEDILYLKANSLLYVSLVISFIPDGELTDAVLKMLLEKLKDSEQLFEKISFIDPTVSTLMRHLPEYAEVEMKSVMILFGRI